MRKRALAGSPKSAVRRLQGVSIAAVGKTPQVDATGGKSAFTLSCKTHSSENSTFPSQGALRARAFTLAEVLLTLAIIGVIAALTIPAVITKITKDQYVTGLKKAYNTLKAVQREAERDYGDIRNWSFSEDIRDFEKYAKPYFDIMKYCESGEEGCFPNEICEVGTDSNRCWDMSGWGPGFITSDGQAWKFDDNSIRNGNYIRVDLNGLKGPNQEGRDVFFFNFLNSYNNSNYNSGDIVGYKPECFDSSTKDINEQVSRNGYCAAVKVLSENAITYY